jgi:hypothetical protein
MTFQPPILAAEERAWNYWFVDGLTSLVVGLDVMLAAFYLFNPLLYPLQWLPKRLGIVLALAAIVLNVVIASRYQQIVVWLKERITYPRTGYVQAPKADPAEAANLASIPLGSSSSPEIQILHVQRRLTWLIAVGLAVAASIAFVLIHARWVWTVAGTIFSVAMIIARKDFRMTWIPPLGFPILGLLITTFAPRHLGGSYFVTGMGLLFVLDGAFTLIRFLIQNPRPKASAQ